ncbi:hypothetical protein [Cellulomonas sp. HD19AZ1]|uniref:hypothetical protein n=1 Tax=Cellulomonas sp. HD19AZ1 TaxID=2559593 RepID=UPI0010713326|nr:hypothetical protein [Cellulomonas sp. HD19AZ1]TFH70615.1 hypothetical protein E4A51_12710 [Cellulomonas sp. HD19AZ1]
MSAAFWISLVTLPAVVTATAVAAWIVAAVWPTLQRWARARRPARVADHAFIDVGRRWGGMGRSGISLRERAVAASSLVQAPRLWTWDPFPGWNVVIARDYEDPSEETKAA